MLAVIFYFLFQVYKRFRPSRKNAVMTTKTGGLVMQEQSPSAYMIKKFLFILTFSIGLNVFGQQTIPASALKTDYLKKSKRHGTTAKVLLIACPVLIAAPFLFTSRDYRRNGDATEGIVYTSMALGMLCLPASIPFFIASARNKKKANLLSATFKMENRSKIQQSSLVQQSYPAIALHIKLQ